MKRNFTIMGTKELLRRIKWYEDLLKVEMNKPLFDEDVIRNIKSDLDRLHIEYAARLVEPASMREINDGLKDNISLVGGYYNLFRDFFPENDN